jgi:hypothetical protein
MPAIEEIYVALLNENIDVWRPIKAQRLQANVYRIVSQPYDTTIETWQFVPGDIVQCEMVRMHEGNFLTAVRRLA